MTQSRYKREKTFEQRREECKNILTKYTGHVPVIVDKDARCALPDIERQKFLVPSDLAMGQFIYVVRRRINLPAQDAIFIFVNRKMPSASATMGQLHAEFKDDDGFLYCVYGADQAYGE
jgi:GABA(A) receptor-associated protein